jgi:hypothetical protein
MLEQQRAWLVREIKDIARALPRSADPTLIALTARLVSIDADRDKLGRNRASASFASASSIATYDVNVSHPSDVNVSRPSGNRWRSLLPGAVNHDDFLSVGHSVFALLCGLVGAAVASWFHARRMRGDLPAASSDS